MKLGFQRCNLHCTIDEVLMNELLHAETHGGVMVHCKALDLHLMYVNSTEPDCGCMKTFGKFLAPTSCYQTANFMPANRLLWSAVWKATTCCSRFGISPTIHELGSLLADNLWHRDKHRLVNPLSIWWDFTSP